MTETKVTCSEGHPVDERTGLPLNQRTPCPVCGSLGRQFGVGPNDVGVNFHERLDVKGKRGGRGKPFVEIRTGDDQRRLDGRWMRKERVIDRERNRYTETVTDPETSEVIHHTDEPLNKHRGHGDARKR